MIDGTNSEKLTKIIDEFNEKINKEYKPIDDKLIKYFDSALLNEQKTILELGFFIHTAKEDQTLEEFIEENGKEKKNEADFSKVRTSIKTMSKNLLRNVINYELSSDLVNIVNFFTISNTGKHNEYKNSLMYKFTIFFIVKNLMK